MADELRIGARRRQAGVGVSFDLALGLLHSRDQAADGFRTFAILIVAAEVLKLACGPRREADQRRDVA